MGSMFKVPKREPISPPPTMTTPSVEEAANREEATLRRRKGYAASIATGPEGVTGAASTTKTRLGE